jgi:excisionase family DNA binding protein
MFGKNEILTPEEVAKILKVNKRTVYRWLDSRKLKAARIGRKTYRVFSSDLDKFIRRHMK